MATQGKTGLKLGTPEWTAMMAQKRAEARERRKAEAVDVVKPTRELAREDALEKLVPAAIKVLSRQLRSEDEKVAANAAVKLLEWGKGKPRQTIEQVGESVQVIRYETSAIGGIN